MSEVSTFEETQSRPKDEWSTFFLEWNGLSGADARYSVYQGDPLLAGKKEGYRGFPHAKGRNLLDNLTLAQLRTQRVVQLDSVDENIRTISQDPALNVMEISHAVGKMVEPSSRRGALHERQAESDEPVREMLNAITDPARRIVMEGVWGNLQLNGLGTLFDLLGRKNNLSARSKADLLQAYLQSKQFASDVKDKNARQRVQEKWQAVIDTAVRQEPKSAREVK